MFDPVNGGPDELAQVFHEPPVVGREQRQQVEHVVGDATRHLVRDPLDGVATLERAMQLIWRRDGGGGITRRSRSSQNYFEDLLTSGSNARVVVRQRHVNVGQRREEPRHQQGQVLDRLRPTRQPVSEIFATIIYKNANTTSRIQRPTNN